MPSSDDPSKKKKHHQSDSGRQDRSERGESRQRSAGKPQAQSSAAVSLRTILVVVTVIAVLAGGIAVVLVFSFVSTVEDSFDDFCGGYKAGLDNLTGVELYGCQSLECEFDITTCDVPCPFGFRVSEFGDVCAESCECASNGIHEGDLIFSDEDLPGMMENYGLMEETEKKEVSLFAYSTLSKSAGKWKKTVGQPRIKIPFLIDKSLTRIMRKFVVEAHKNYAKETCIDFVPAKPYVDATTPYDRKSVVFMDGRGCATKLGTTAQGQFAIYLASRCSKVGIVQHEIMHMLGYNHEHCHPLRDNYIEILYDRIRPGVSQNFKKMLKSDSYDLGIQYDKKSLLHYGGRAFSIGTKPTIMDKATKIPIVHQREKFTPTDIKKINTYYCVNSKDYVNVDGAISATAPPTVGYDKHHWSSWSLWTNCYLTCSPTRPKRYRYRTCQIKVKTYGIQYRRGMCEGERSASENCPGVQTCDGKPTSTNTGSSSSSSYGSTATASRPGSSYGSTATASRPGSSYGSTATASRPGSTYGSTATASRPGSSYGSTATASRPGSSYGSTATASRPGSSYGSTATASRPGSSYGSTATVSRPGTSYGSTSTVSRPGTSYGSTATVSRPGTSYGSTATVSRPGTSYGSTATVSRPGTSYGSTATVSRPGTSYGSTATVSRPGTSYGSSATVSRPGTSYGSTATVSRPGTSYGSTATASRPGYGNTGSTGYGTTGSTAYGSTAPKPSAAAWTPWLHWTSCWKTCGTTPPVHRRYRTCKGTGCIGKQVDTRNCPAVQPCSTVTAWQQWGPASKCTKTCGGGFQYRYRKCSQHGKCPGLTYSTRPCNTQKCFAGQSPGTGAVGGPGTCTCPGSSLGDAIVEVPTPSWGPFGPAEPCSRSCGFGKQYRYRKCLLNGRQTTGCPGQFYDLRSCNTQQCPGGYGDETSDQVFDAVSDILLQVCSSNTKNVWLFGNFNSDKKIDVMCGEKEGGNMKMAMSTTGADFFLSDDMAPLEDCGRGKKLVADFDGDGADDILCRSPGKIQFKLMRKSGAFSSGFDNSLSFCTDGEIKVLDFTGDGESDLMCWNKHKKSSSLLIKRNKEF